MTVSDEVKHYFERFERLERLEPLGEAKRMSFLQQPAQFSG
jgi:hypothetical protein